MKNKNKLKTFLLTSLTIALSACGSGDNDKKEINTEDKPIIPEVSIVESDNNKVTIDEENTLKPTTDDIDLNKKNTKALLEELKDVKVLPEVQEMVLKVIQEGVKTGKIKEGEYTVDDLMIFSKSFSKAIQENQINGDDDIFEQMQELNNLLDGRPSQELITKINKVDIDVYNTDEARKIGDIIKNKVPETIVNSVFQIKNTKYFTAYINNSDSPLFTDNENKYFILYNNGQKGIFLTDKGEEMKTTKEYSQVYKDIMNNIDTSNLVKFKFGKGERKMFVFTDPDCPYCQKLDTELHNNLKDSDNVTIYYVMNPLLSIHPDAGNKAAKILCSDDKNKAWENWQFKRELSELSVNKNIDSCLELVENQMTYGQMIGINTTPTIVNQNGIFIEGVLNIGQFRTLITLETK